MLQGLDFTLVKAGSRLVAAQVVELILLWKKEQGRLGVDQAAVN